MPNDPLRDLERTVDWLFWFAVLNTVFWLTVLVFVVRLLSAFGTSRVLVVG